MTLVPLVTESSTVNDGATVITGLVNDVGYIVLVYSAVINWTGVLYRNYLAGGPAFGPS
jgi:hypothetical protein